MTFSYKRLTDHQPNLNCFLSFPFIRARSPFDHTVRQKIPIRPAAPRREAQPSPTVNQVIGAGTSRTDAFCELDF